MNQSTSLIGVTKLGQRCTSIWPVSRASSVGMIAVTASWACLTEQITLKRCCAG